MNETINIAIRTIIVLLVLFIITKLMGKKQVSQLNIFDYIIGITIGSIAADISLDIEKNLIAGLLSVTIYGVFAYLISYITMKSITLRRFIIGVPTVLMENNEIIESALKKTHIDINDLMEEARINGYFNLEEIDCAIMEVSGEISFKPKEQEKTPTKKDLKINTQEPHLTANIIIDETLLEENLNQMNKDKKWLNHQLKLQGYNNYQGILLATLDNNNKLKIYKKNQQGTQTSILE